MTDFCKACGARIPPAYGEGTCPTCDPVGVELHTLRRDNAALRAERDRLGQQVDKWARLSERHGWLDPEDFDKWVSTQSARVEKLAAALAVMTKACQRPTTTGLARAYQQAMAVLSAGGGP